MKIFSGIATVISLTAVACLSGSIALVLCMLCISGCEEVIPPPPIPKIEVEAHDTTEQSGVTVKYYDHHTHGNPTTVTLNSPEEVEEYKKQVEFLLKQLEDAERKMAIKADTDE